MLLFCTRSKTCVVKVIKQTLSIAIIAVSIDLTTSFRTVVSIFLLRRDGMPKKNNILYKIEDIDLVLTVVVGHLLLFIL